MIEHPYYESLGLKIDEKSFRECYIDPEKSIGRDILQVYPDLNQWVEFKDHPKKYPTQEYKNTQVIRFIVAMYDPKSPFRYLEYQTRKSCAAIYAAFKTGVAGDFTFQAQEIMNGNIEAVNLMIIRYCIIVRGFEWITYLEWERRYYELSLPNPDAKIKDLKAEMDIVTELRNNFLAGDSTPEIHRTVYKISTENELKARLNKLRPEYQEQYFYNKIALNREEIEAEQEEYAESEED